MRPDLPFLVLAGAVLAGCSAPEPQGFTQVTMRLANDGQTGILVPITITADGEPILAQTVSVPGGGSTERSVAPVPKASYLLRAEYHAVTSDGNDRQEFNDRRTHTLEWDDCEEGTVLVTFPFAYSAGGGSQRFSTGTSRGECQPAP